MEREAPSMTRVPFGRYILKERLAQGGMGEVFRAIAVGEAGFEKPVVIKRILPAHAGRSDFADLFVAEAKLMTRLAHPNIVEVLDFGRGEGGEAFLVLELVRGLDLGRLGRAYAARGEPFPLPLALFITAQILRGLHHAHARSEGGGWLVHRDISPGNVLLSTEGEVKVADFGVALVARPGDPKGPTGLVGKPGYMAPEQFDGRDLDPRADLFSVGVVLFELLAGRLPFAGNTFLEQQASAHRGDFTPAAELRADVPAAVDAVLRRALAPRREDRFPDAKAMAQAIEGLRDAGVRIAGSDDMADAVRAAMPDKPAGQRVIALAGSIGRDRDEPPSETPTDVGGERERGSPTDVGGDRERGSPTDVEEPERELSRTFGPAGVGAFTMRVTERRTLRIDDSAGAEGAPPGAARSHGPGTLPVLTATPTAEEPSAPPELPLTQPLLSRGAIMIVVVLLGLLALFAIGLSFRKHNARRHEAPLPSAEPPPPKVSTIEPPPIPVEVSTPIAPSTPAPITPAPHHPSSVHAPSTSPPSAAPAAPSASGGAEASCEGIVRIASNGSFLVSGGPHPVQSPGLYTWRCGTFSLTAVYRADPAQVKHAQVTIRAGATSIVDLR